MQKVSKCKFASPQNRIWPLGQAVKTSPFHGGNMGPNPVGVTKSKATARLLCFKEA